MTLRRAAWTVPETVPFGDAELKPLRGGETLAWKLHRQGIRMIDNQARIALLIDADNSPSSKIDVILAELAKIGVANIRRAYGNWKKDGLKGWEGVLHEYAIRPIQQFDYSKGKNATDMGMVIDAMDLLYTDRPEAFGIVSSDSDFTPLVMHLKAKGAQVYGFGAKKTPMPFVNACSRFLYLENLGRTPPKSTSEAKPETRGRRHARRGRRAVAREADEAASPARPEAAADERRRSRLDSGALRQDATPRRRCCAMRSNRRSARTAGRRSARSASRSATRPRSTRATTATAS